MKILSSHVTQDNWNCTMSDFTGLCQVQNVAQLKLLSVNAQYPYTLSIYMYVHYTHTY